MQSAWLYSADLLNAASMMSSTDTALQQAIREAEASADVTFPDGALFVFGMPNIERSWQLHKSMAERACEEADDSEDYRMLHFTEVPLVLCQRFGHCRVMMDFWTIQWSGREPADSLVSFLNAAEFSCLRVIITFLKRAKPDVLASAANRAQRLLDSLTTKGIGDEEGIKVLSPVEAASPKAIHFTIDASSTGMRTMTWLGYQLYLLRDVWPVEDVMDERTAQGIVVGGPRSLASNRRERGIQGTDGDRN